MKKPWRKWVYHAEHEPKIVMSDEAEKLYEEGWVNTPAKIKGVLDQFNVEPGDEMSVQQVGESIQGVVDSTNGALNLDDMTKRELVEYAQEHHKLRLDQNTNKTDLIKKIRKAIGD